MVVKEGIVNPPDIGTSMPVDIRSVNDVDGNIVGVNFIMLTSPLPTDIEGKFDTILPKVTFNKNIDSLQSFVFLLLHHSIYFFNKVLSSYSSFRY